MRQPDGLAGLAQHADTARHAAAFRIEQPHFPRARLAGLPDRSYLGEQIERLAGRGVKPQGPVFTRTVDNPSSASTRPRPAAIEIPSVGEQVVADVHRNEGQRLAWDDSLIAVSWK